MQQVAAEGRGRPAVCGTVGGGQNLERGDWEGRGAVHWGYAK